MTSPESTHGEKTAATGSTLFIITSLVFLVLSTLMLAGHPGFLLAEVLTGHAQAWISLLVFGFGLPAVYGAVYAALPRAFGLPVWSGQAVLLHYGIHLAGLMIVILLPFVPDLPQAAWGAGLMACGGGIFIVTTAMTLRGMARPDAASAYLSTVMVWLAVVLFLGLPFSSRAPLTLFAGTNWSVGLLVFLVGGVLFNAMLGLALRVTPAVLGCKPERTAAAWYALAILNAGIAWVFAAATFGPPAFLLFCAVILITGALIYLSDFRNLLERRGGGLSCEVRMLRAAVWMIPMAALLLIHNAGERLQITPSVSADAVELIPAPAAVSSLDWTLGLVAVFAAAIPGMLGIIFQLQKLNAGGDKPEQGFLGRLLPAAFGVYAAGTALLITGVWTGAGMLSSFGAALLALGALGFLGSFVGNLLPRPSNVSSGAVV